MTICNIPMNHRVKADSFKSFKSVGYKVLNAIDMFPAFSGIRVTMMPFHAHDVDGSLPSYLAAYKPMLKAMIAKSPEHVALYDGTTGYLTIDEMDVQAGQIQRKSQLHVDGMYKGELSGAWGGGGGGWGSCGNGMLLCSNTNDLCHMWTGEFQGVPVDDGNCEHLRDQLHDKEFFSFQAGDVIWADGLMVHESLPALENVQRQFVRVSLPNNSPWFEGYTANPLGILPFGPILSERRI